MAAVYRLSTSDFSQISRSAILARLERWRQVWASVDAERVRLVVRTTPMSLDAPMKRSRQRLAETEDPKAGQHIRSYTGLLSKASKRALFGFEHYLVLPTLEPSEAKTTVNLLLTGMGLQGVPVSDLPRLLPTRYRADTNCLLPEQSGYPLFSILVSYDMKGEWGYNVLVDLLQRPGIALSIDVKTYQKGQAYTQLDRLQNVQDGLASQLGAKTALKRLITAHRQLTEGIQYGDALHQVSVGVLISGRTREDLRKREDDVRSDVAGNLSLRRVDGQMDELFRSFFTSQESMVSPRLYRNMTSKGLAVASGPLGIRKRSQTDGVLWGFSGSSPFFWDGFGPDLNEPNHGVILGATGSGKTTSLFSVALREMNLMDSQVIVMEPMGNCVRLVEAVGEDRASYNPLRLDRLRFNPLEVIYETPAQQMAHLTVVIALLLGRDVQGLDETEKAVIERAAGMIYEGVTPDTPPVNHPRIENLVWALKNSGATGWIADLSQQMGELLEERYVRGALGTVFNTATLNDWRLTKDLVAFDFQGIPEEQGLRSLLYYLVLSTIRREAHRQKRARRRILLIDEFRALSEHPTLANQVALMYKTFRTLGVGVWALEQDAVTFVGAGRGGATARDVKAGIHILANATFRVVLAQRSIEGERLPDFLPQMTPDHVKMVTSLSPFETDRDKGRGLVVLSSAVYPIKFHLTSHELSLLGGT
jgi:hypothetical protein